MGQRDDLLAGAKTCLIEKGYSRTTARDIAAASGAHLASIGYHFGSKDNLMNTAVLEVTGEWGDHILEAATRAAQAATPGDRLRLMLEELLAALPRDRSLLVASVQAYAQAQFAEQVRAPLAEAVEEGRAGLAAAYLGVAPADVDAATARGLGALLYSVIVGLVVQSLVAPPPLPTASELGEAIALLASPAAQPR
ncbi:TetR/AcrR family transcriptional regulator [Nonomuraea longicatena]